MKVDIVWRNSAGELDRVRVVVPEGDNVDPGALYTLAAIKMLTGGSLDVGDTITVEEV